MMGLDVAYANLRISRGRSDCYRRTLKESRVNHGVRLAASGTLFNCLYITYNLNQFNVYTCLYTIAPCIF